MLFTTNALNYVGFVCVNQHAHFYTAVVKLFTNCCRSVFDVPNRSKTLAYLGHLIMCSINCDSHEQITYQFCMQILIPPINFLIEFLKILSINRLIKTGDNTHSCQTPLVPNFEQSSPCVS